MTTKKTRCKCPAADGLRKCDKHAVSFLRRGGDEQALRRAQVPALQVAVHAGQDDRIIGDTGATNHTARPEDLVAKLPGSTLCETNGGYVDAQRGLAHVPLETAPQPAVVLNGPRCASIGKLTRKNGTGLPSRLFTMAGGEAGFITDPELAARFMDTAKACGAWSHMDVVDDVPLFPRNCSLTHTEPTLTPAVMNMLGKVYKECEQLYSELEALEEFYEFYEAYETREELEKTQTRDSLPVDKSPAAHLTDGLESVDLLAHLRPEQPPEIELASQEASKLESCSADTFAESPSLSDRPRSGLHSEMIPRAEVMTSAPENASKSLSAAAVIDPDPRAPTEHLPTSLANVCPQGTSTANSGDPAHARQPVHSDDHPPELPAQDLAHTDRPPPRAPAPRLGLLGTAAVLLSLASPAHSAPVPEGVELRTDPDALGFDETPDIGLESLGLDWHGTFNFPPWSTQGTSFEHEDKSSSLEQGSTAEENGNMSHGSENSQPARACATRFDESADLTTFKSIKALPADHHSLTHRGGCTKENCSACEAAKMTQNPITKDSGFDRGEDARLHMDSVGPSRQGATADGATAKYFTLAVHPKTQRIWKKLFKKLSPENTVALMKEIERTLEAAGQQLTGFRTDQGPEMSGKSIDAHLGETGLRIDYAIPGEHAHLIERYVRTVTEGVRAARLAAGLPPSAWPAALSHWLENWNRTVAELPESEKHGVAPVPFGVGMRYMPTEDEKVKERRFEAVARIGIVVGYANTMPRAYMIADFDQLKAGRWRVTTTRAAKPLVDCEGEPVFPVARASDKVKKAIAAIFDRRAGGNGGSTQMAMTELADFFSTTVAAEAQLVTRAIPATSPEYHTKDALEARHAEADKLNRFYSFDWNTLDEWNKVTQKDSAATKVGGRMLLSSKFEEKPPDERELKGRYILQGYRQIDKDGRNILKTWKQDNPELLSLPLQQHELRALLAAGIRAGRSQTKIAVVDEESAYVQEVLDGDAVWLDLSKENARDVVPAELRAQVMEMRCPVVKVHKACYGLKRSIFAYEAGRDERLMSTGLTRVRGTRCVFKFVDSLGREAFLGVFVDDAIIIGHEGAVADLLKRLQNKRADGTALFTYKKAPELATTAHVLGIDVRLELHDEHGAAHLSAPDFVHYWTDKVQSEYGVRLKDVKCPHAQPQVSATDAATGRFAECARSVVMAAYWHARMCAPAMIQPCSALARRFDDWSHDEDRRLLHALAYWKTHAEDELTLSIGYNDTYSLDIYVDSDHASDHFTRRSTTGAAIMLSGKQTTVNLDNVCKQQTRIARSSGDAESRGIDTVVRSLLIDANANTDITHATVHSLAQKGVPILEMLEDLGFTISSKSIHVDAAVALTAATRGHSKVMQYLSKTQGVDLGWLAETISDLDFKLTKVNTADNLSDIFTKGVTAEVLARLLPHFGMSQGVTRN